MEPGFETTIDGVTVHTRFPWRDFDRRWQAELLDYVKSEYRNAPPGYEVAKVFIDHINVAAETFHPRIDLRLVK